MLMYVCVFSLQVAPVILSDEEAIAAAGTSGGGVVRTANTSTTPVEGTGADACCGPQVPHMVLGCRQHLHTYVTRNIHVCNLVFVYKCDSVSLICATKPSTDLERPVCVMLGLA